MTVNIGINGLVAQHVLPQCLVAHFHCLAESRVLQQSLPHGWSGIVAGTLEVPCFGVVGIGKVRIAIGQVVIPHRSCHQFSTCSILMLLLLVEIGTAFVAIGIEAQFGVDEIINERRYIDVAGISRLRVGKTF